MSYFSKTNNKNYSTSDETSVKTEKSFCWDTSRCGNKEKEDINYNLISFISSKKKPDIYVGDKVIFAKNYRVLDGNSPKSNEKLENKINNEDSIIDSPSLVSKRLKNDDLKKNEESEVSSDLEKEYTDMKKKEIRYFNTTSNITIKCFNCNEVGHMARNCPNEIRVICHKCNMAGHFEWDCNIMKCFKCHKPGHKFTECTVQEKDLIRCDACKSIGHKIQDCIANPKKIKTNNITCNFCGKNHSICSLFTKNNEDLISDYHSDAEEVSEDLSYHDDHNKQNSNDEDLFREKIQKRKKKKIQYLNLDSKSVKYTNFCSKCAGKHKKSECDVKQKENSFEKRKQLLQQNFYERDKFYDRSSKKTKPLAYHEEVYSSDSSEEFLGKKRNKTIISSQKEERVKKNNNVLYNIKRDDSPNDKMMFNSLMMQDNAKKFNFNYVINKEDTYKNNNYNNERNKREPYKYDNFYDRNNRDYNHNRNRDFRSSFNEDNYYRKNKKF